MSSPSSALSPSEELAVAEHSMQADALYFEYSQAADPIGAGVTSAVPYAEFPASLHESGPSRVVPLDLSESLGCQGPATSPGLCASFVRLEANESLCLQPNASSQVYYVMRGQGVTRFSGGEIAWGKGDIFCLPAGGEAVHEASTDAALYWVHDAPLLSYLGARVDAPTFRPTLYPSARLQAELAKAEGDPAARDRSRLSVLLANRACPATRTATPTLWAMFGVLPVGDVQMPHRHQSVALDLIIDCKPGCYTLVGRKLGPNDEILEAKRVDWQPNSAFVTPPGYWHAHYNESGERAFLLPIQDAGLQTFLRSLDIRFTKANAPHWSA